MEERSRKGGMIAFMVALAGLITAVGTLLNAAGAFRSNAGAGAPHDAVSTSWSGASSRPPSQPSSPQPSPPESTPPTTLQPTRPAPAVNTAQSLDVPAADSALSEIREALGAQSGLVEECSGGESSACAAMLVDLTDGCEIGFGTACDGLYAVTAAGSALSTYGATCGYRYSASLAGRCAEL